MHYKYRTKIPPCQQQCHGSAMTPVKNKNCESPVWLVQFYIYQLWSVEYKAGLHAYLIIEHGKWESIRVCIFHIFRKQHEKKQLKLQTGFILIYNLNVIFQYLFMLIKHNNFQCYHKNRFFVNTIVI